MSLQYSIPLKEQFTICNFTDNEIKQQIEILTIRINLNLFYSEIQSKLVVGSENIFVIKKKDQSRETESFVETKTVHISEGFTKCFIRSERKISNKFCFKCGGIYHCGPTKSKILISVEESDIV